MNLEKLNNTYRQKWVNKFGNSSNASLEQMWNDTFETLFDIANRNALRKYSMNDISEDKIQPRTVVFSSTMGSGKSTTLQHYLQHGLNDSYKALIIVELIETCDEYEAVLKDKNAVAIHSKNERDLYEYLNAPILIITHNRLTTLLKEGFADDIFDRYDLIAIDEQINTYQHVSFTLKELTIDIIPILENYNVLSQEDMGIFTFLVDQMKELEKEHKGNAIQIHQRYTDEVENFLNLKSIAQKIQDFLALKGGKFEQARHYTKLDNCATRLRTLSKQGRMKVSFFQKEPLKTTFNVVIDFLPIHISKVIFDGTASINDTYKLLNEHINKNTVEVKHYAGLRTFTNASIKYYKIATGKSKLTISANKMQDNGKYAKQIEDVKASLEELVNGVKELYPIDEKVLFVIHKDNVELLSPMIINTQWDITYWGKHVGSNDWKDYSKVVIYGLNYLPEETYRAIFYSTMSSRTKTDIAPIDDLKAGLISSDILQAMFRGQIRVAINNGNCKENTEIIISLPNNNLCDEILDRLKVIVPDAEYEEINWIKRVDSDSANRKKMYTLISYLNMNSNKDYLSPSEVKKAIDAPIRDLLDRGVNYLQNRIELEKQGWIYKELNDDDKLKYNPNGNNKKLFIKNNNCNYDF